MVERQQEIVDSLQTLGEEQKITQEELEVWHAEIRGEILREEMDRVVTMVQDVNSSHPTNNEMVQRVRALIAKGGDSESAQKALVDDLVAQSQEEVHRRVHEAFEPVRVEAEAGLYARELAMVHELEALEAKVAALRGGALRETATDLGFEFGLAAEARGRLEQPPPRRGAPLAEEGGGGAPALVRHSTPRSAATRAGTLPGEPAGAGGRGGRPGTPGRAAADGGPAAAPGGEAYDAQASPSSLPADSLLMPLAGGCFFSPEPTVMAANACGSAPDELMTAHPR